MSLCQLWASVLKIVSVVVSSALSSCRSPDAPSPGWGHLRTEPCGKIPQRQREEWGPGFLKVIMTKRELEKNPTLLKGGGVGGENL